MSLAVVQSRAKLVIEAPKILLIKLFLSNLATERSLRHSVD